MRKKVYIKLIFLFLVSILIFAFFMLVIHKDKAMNPNDIVKTDIINLISTEKKFLSETKFGDFTCTGLTYDKKEDDFWIADYGAQIQNETPSPRIIQYDKNFKKIKRVIYLNHILDKTANLQGISYDSKTDSIWLATGEYIYNINKKGHLLSRIHMGKYSKYMANGLVNDEKTDSLWVLCYSKYILNMKKNGSIIKVFDFNYQDQDQICFDKDGSILVTVGADYSGDNNYIFAFNTNNGHVEAKYRLKDSYAIEGISVVDGKLFIANDGKYHNAKINKSYIGIYER